jgi:hypothetical protein
VKSICLLSSGRALEKLMSQWAKDSKKVPQTRGRGQVVEGKYQPTRRRASSWEENIVSLSGLEGYEED